MAKRPSIYQRSQQATKRARAERNKQIRRLKELGLIRKAPKTAVQRRNVLQKYRDVLQRRAAVVTVPKGFKIKSLKKSFRVSGLNVVVPRQKGERVRVEKSTGRIVSTREVGGERVKRIYVFGGKIPQPRKGKKLLYTVPFANGARVRYESLEDLEAFMRGYQTFKNWRDYMEVDEIDADEEPEE